MTAGDGEVITGDNDADNDAGGDDVDVDFVHNRISDAVAMFTFVVLRPPARPPPSS